ncbi:serine hydrolase domain-containing protein [Nocardia huaxiensis]|uniref:Serine hydrolase n=1 Tax=Nocardia huaxiensis TaxID=2755382 RepID=A0A7D6VIQ5_9NOCA|nr:serine hydrolase [Nocardia huaxiensis]QLY30470.1 serine hydrolase [Nocardia huaxiensis]UFS95931.1 beta-lactamase family protein [Nocardia huaxiensis]
MEFAESPARGVEFPRATPEAVGLDPVAVRDAVAFSERRSTRSIRIYRYGQLVATGERDAVRAHAVRPVWSASKSILAMVTGRAVTLGLLELDDPIGRYVPEADARHRDITVRNLLNQSSGLAFRTMRELAIPAYDQVRLALTAEPKHAPGTYFEYAQAPLSLLGHVVARAAGTDSVTFAQRELFTPLGIGADRWRVVKDRAGHPYWAGLVFATAHDLARFGHTLLRDGKWADEDLLSPDFVRQARTPAPTNPGYGFLVWLNASIDTITCRAPGRSILDRPVIASAPADTYLFSGMFDQIVAIIPSLDMVIVRTGQVPNRTADITGMMSVITAEWAHEFFRRLFAGHADPAVPADPGPFRADGLRPLLRGRG